MQTSPDLRRKESLPHSTAAPTPSPLLSILPLLGVHAQNYPGVSGKESLLDKYEYVMYGTVYKYKDDKAGGE